MSNAFNFPTGTVKLLVTQSGEEITSLVSADALVMASPVWKKFLFPPWEQTGSSINSEPPAGERTAKQIDCRGDDGDALLVLLNIIHLRFSLVPKKPGYVLLLQLAVLVDQYDCIDITRPWLESWMEGETTECVREDQEGWLFISWVFGRDATFKKLSRHLVTKSTAGPLSTESDVDLQVLLTPSGKYFLDTMPPEILEAIMRCRHDMLVSLLHIPYTKLLVIQMQFLTLTVCKSGTLNRESCDAAVYGSLILGLTKENLYPRKAPYQISASVEDVAASLKRIKLQAIRDSKGGPNEENTHLFCATGMSGKIDTAMSKVGNPVLDCHRRHMAIQRGEVVPTPAASLGGGV